MLSGSATLLAMVVLATLSAGGLAYAFLFSRVSGGGRSEKRFDEIKVRRIVPDPSARLNDPTKRRKSIQETLKEL